jgi:hypothetical protein
MDSDDDTDEALMMTVVAAAAKWILLDTTEGGLDDSCCISIAVLIRLLQLSPPLNGTRLTTMTEQYRSPVRWVWRV